MQCDGIRKAELKQNLMKNHPDHSIWFTRECRDSGNVFRETINALKKAEGSIQPEGTCVFSVCSRETFVSLKVCFTTILCCVPIMNQPLWFIISHVTHCLSGTHTFQRIYGCEWDKETNEGDGMDQYHFDGEDFIEFDRKTNTWISQMPWANVTKTKQRQI